MPQVHSKQRLLDQDPSAFSKNSRYMASLKFTEGSVRRMNALNTTDKRLAKIQVNYFERNADISLKKYEKARLRLIDKMQKHLAYKLVLKRHRIAKAKDYKKALDGNYSYHALHYEINDMMNFIQPDVVRERKARALINENRRRYDGLLRKNAEQSAILFPMKKTWEAFDFSKIKTKEERKDNEDEKTPDEAPGGTTGISTLPKLDPRRGRALVRRIIEEPQSRKGSKPGSPKPLSRSPTKTQGITMSMMKKQKSFLENQKSLVELDNSETEVQAIDASKETDTVAAKGILKTPENRTDELKENLRHSISLPPIQTKGNDKKLKKRNSVAKLENISSASENSKVKLPVLKLNKRPQASEEITVQG